MAQEIVTYTIVIIAVITAIVRIYTKLSVRKKEKTPEKKVAASLHNCSDCIAECTLRDAAPLLKKENEEICETTVVKAKVPSTDG